MFRFLTAPGISAASQNRGSFSASSCEKQDSTMTTSVTMGNNSKRRDGAVFPGNGINAQLMSPEFKVRMFLFVACLWPLWVLALFHASAPGHNQQTVKTMADAADRRDMSSPASAVSNARLNLRNVLDRVDVMGYGPTHPRVAVVIVGEEKEDIIATTESVYSNTDLNRIFVICAVLDGHHEDLSFVSELRKIDNGSKCFVMNTGSDIFGNKSSDHSSLGILRRSSLAWYPGRSSSSRDTQGGRRGPAFKKNACHIQSYSTRGCFFSFRCS
jgi:hypothetical protein